MDPNSNTDTANNLNQNKALKLRETIPIYDTAKSLNYGNSDDNTAYLTQHFSPIVLNEDNASIFATFGYKDPRYFVRLKIKDVQVLALLDSGSSRTYVCPSVAKLLGKSHSSDLFMKAANNNLLRVNGVEDVKYSLKGVEKVVSTRHIEALKYECIFGIDFMREYGMRIDFASGNCSLRGGASWKWDFPDEAGGCAYPIIDSISALNERTMRDFSLISQSRVKQLKPRSIRDHPEPILARFSNQSWLIPRSKFCLGFVV